jgi:predicted Zn-ribbon and HTH transcriptional regulator
MPMVSLTHAVNPIHAYIRQKVFHENGNVVILISGNPGGGKTFSGMALGVGLCWEFGEYFIVTSITQLLELLIKATQEPDWIKGKVILYEEVQEEQTNKRSNATEAVNFTQVLASFRSLNAILIMTSPKAWQLTKDSRSYVDIHMVAESINKDEQLCRCKVLFAEHNHVSEKTYWKFLEVDEGGQIRKLTHMLVWIPPKNLCDHYNSIKLNFQKKSYEEKLKQVEQKKEKLQKKTYPQECVSCGYKWEARSEQPKKCPSCQVRLLPNPTT